MINNNDIDPGKFTVSQGTTVTYTISGSTNDVDVVNNNNFNLTLSSADRVLVNGIFNKNSYKSFNDSLFYLSAGEDWNTPANVSFEIIDEYNPVTVSGVPNYAPQVTNVTLKVIQ
ncbi:MAG: hypothetical protein HC905_17550 [Bacteroidales bacterium]|nr:hypothetical protein [Bacteroidales bacterium]